MGFSEFLGNEAMVAALRGALRTDRVPHAMLFHRAARRGKIHTRAHVCAGRQLRTPQRRFLRRVRNLPAIGAPCQLARSDRPGSGRTRRKRRCGHRRTHSTDSADASRCVGAGARSGALEKPRWRVRCCASASFAPCSARPIFNRWGGVASSSWTARNPCAPTFPTSS